MEELWISTGASRMASRWRQERVSWEELRERLLRMPETPETASEYRAMSRQRQTEVKDIGGFVGGRLRDGVRKAANVEGRGLVTLDYDSFSAEHLERVRRVMEELGCAWVVHSTHKHSEHAWRCRLVVPAGREMDLDEFGAVSRRVAEMCGTEGLDPTTFEPCRLMFWGSRSKGAPYIAESGGEKGLDVDAILSTYADWKDVSQWPLLEREAGIFTMAADTDAEAMRMRNEARMPAGLKPNRQEDPLEKRGLIGAFCRTYDIHGAIDKFLPGTYRRMRGNRYTYNGASTAGGAVVMDGGRYLYSFHATDPCGLRLMNSWDLVRGHLYGHLDASAERDSRGDRLPSYKAMEALAMEDPDCRLRLMEERMEATAGDFDGFDLEPEDIRPEAGGGDELRAAGDSPAGTPGGNTGKAWKAWKVEMAKKLKPQKDGTLKTTIATCATVIDGDPRLKGKVWLDDFAGKIRVEGELPWRRTDPCWNNNDDALLRSFLDRNYGLSGAAKVDDALIEVANRYGYHPVRRYLQGLPEWDGERRVGRLFTEILGAEDTELNGELAKLMCVGAVARILDPGCKYDYFIILKGPEGARKSGLLRALGGEWFSDSIPTIEGKEGMASIQGKWIIELAELVSVKRSDVEALKSFISRQEDQYRPAYGRKEEYRPRQCVMVGTTNEDLFLRGITTGNRRQPVVEIKPELRKIEGDPGDWVEARRDQIWAEALHLYRGGYRLYLDDRLSREVRKVQDEYNLDKQNSVFPEIDRFLDLWLPDTWEDSYTQDDRTTWIRQNGMRPQGDGEEEPFGFERRGYVTVPEILQELLGMKRTDPGYLSRSREVGQYLNSREGWKNIGVRKNRLYGKQKTWQRLATEPESLGCHFGCQPDFDLNDL